MPRPPAEEVRELCASIKGSATRPEDRETRVEHARIHLVAFCSGMVARNMDVGVDGVKGEVE